VKASRTIGTSSVVAVMFNPQSSFELQEKDTQKHGKFQKNQRENGHVSVKNC